MQYFIFGIMHKTEMLPYYGNRWHYYHVLGANSIVLMFVTQIVYDKVG